jgi:hypothetical protein
MATAVQSRTPVHLWAVGILSLLWNCFGAYDYLMTRMRNTEYLSQMGDPAALLAWVDGFPLYAQIGWGLGVWAAFIGSILLLLRNRYAVWAFGLSLVGMALSFGYTYLIGPPMPGSENAGMMQYMPLVIVVIGIFLFAYSRAMERNGVLR